MNASLYQKSVGTVAQAGKDTAPAEVELMWDAADPVAITLAITVNGVMTPWEVARTLVIASIREPMCGSWVGYLNVACHAGRDQFQFCFYPRRRPTMLRLPVSDVVEFAEHSERLVRSHGAQERAIVLADLEQTLPGILAAERDGQ